MTLKDFTVPQSHTDLMQRDHIWRAAFSLKTNREGLNFEEWMGAVLAFTDVMLTDTVHRHLSALRYNGVIYGRAAELFGIDKDELRTTLLKEWDEGVDPSEWAAHIANHRNK